MKKLVFILFNVFVLSSFCQTTDVQKTLESINNSFKNTEVKLLKWPKSMQSKLGELKDTAFIAFPKKSKKTKLPLLISLHGGGGKTWTIEEQLNRSSKVKGLHLAELAGKELILLEPNSHGKWNPDTLNTMLDYILETYTEIDRNRIYVMGHSMGGRGTWDWIQKSPERFAAAAPCGFSGISQNENVDKLINLPVFGMVGGSDGKNVSSVKTMASLLKAAGNPNVEYIAFPEANHAQGNKAVFSHVQWIDWMLTFPVH
ncbi:dienelactone hydrolase family protein [Seonamhaeicola sp. ML3]|uniref:carboxylesterase family protein n=1 Tax=Seonamhaeicola sp. ML3 TaxID=2937786 RepID=UPI00200DCBCA|nr:dienelactone hydrolase family protein [Seonamhaeicola sp. ML3]